MSILINGTVSNTGQAGRFMAEEAAALAALRAEGSITTAFRSSIAPHFVGLSPLTDQNDLEQRLASLPLMREGLLTFTYQAVTEI